MNLKFPLLLSFALLASCSTTAKPKETTFDALYVSEEIPTGHSVSRIYLKFYKDGMVKYVSSISPGVDTILFIDATNDRNKISIGRYVSDDQNIHFTTTSNYGAVDFEGRFIGGDLVLTGSSKITGVVSTYRYRLYKQ